MIFNVFKGYQKCPYNSIRVGGMRRQPRKFICNPYLPIVPSWDPYWPYWPSLESTNQPIHGLCADDYACPFSSLWSEVSLSALVYFSRRMDRGGTSEGREVGSGGGVPSSPYSWGWGGGEGGTMRARARGPLCHILMYYLCNHP